MKKTNLLNLVPAALLVFAISSVGLSQDKITKSFQVKKGENLSVKVSGDVKVDSWSKDEVYVEVTGLDEDDVEDLTMKQEGNIVSIPLFQGYARPAAVGQRRAISGAPRGNVSGANSCTTGYEYSRWLDATG